MGTLKLENLDVVRTPQEQPFKLEPDLQLEAVLTSDKSWDIIPRTRGEIHFAGKESCSPKP